KTQIMLGEGIQLVGGETSSHKIGGTPSATQEVFAALEPVRDVERSKLVDLDAPGKDLSKESGVPKTSLEHLPAILETKIMASSSLSDNLSGYDSDDLIVVSVTKRTTP